MSITSMLFLFLFLPLSLAIYNMANDKVKEAVLLVISVLFYTFGSPQYIVLLIGSILISVAIGRTISRLEKKKIRKILLTVGIMVNAGILFYYKYFDFVLTNIFKGGGIETQIKGQTLPLGLSFFTFKAISFLIDMYSGKAVLKEKPISDALYLSFFPQIQSGPLTRYNDMVKSDDDKILKGLFSDGVYRFLIGFSKKVLLANVLSNITVETFSTPFESLSTGYAWLGSVCFSLQLFFDFSGYSDMAIGLSEMFGYRCMENFDYPYMTESITRFWRRWHISLSEWFRDYIYIPLGGSKNKQAWRVYFNLFVVWTLTGIWHGASWNFLFWGVGYFLIIAFERFTNLPGRLNTRVGKVVYRILSLLFINFQWVIFNSENLLSGLKYIKRMLIWNNNELTDMRMLFLLKDYAFFIIVAIILCFPVVPWLSDKLEDKKVGHIIYEVVVSAIIVFSFVWAISFVVTSHNNPFAYANF